MNIIKKIFRLIKRISVELSIYLPLKKTNASHDVIVSLTSYPERLCNIHKVILSLLRQTTTPRKIILWLGTDTAENQIPRKLRKLEKNSGGLFQIRTNVENIKPHKKYFFVMQENPEAIIVTVDDDLFYDKNLLSDLLESYEKNPHCVHARRVNLMKKTDDGKIDKYANWEWECKKITDPSFALLPTGCGGVLYPPKILPQDTFQMEAIKENCLNTDDIWLKFMELKAGVKVVFTNNRIVHPLTIRKSQKTALMHNNAQNSTENINDINISKMENFTGINMGDYAEL